jgi:hypothetical protein
LPLQILSLISLKILSKCWSQRVSLYFLIYLTLILKLSLYFNRTEGGAETTGGDIEAENATAGGVSEFGGFGLVIRAPDASTDGWRVSGALNGLVGIDSNLFFEFIRVVKSIMRKSNWVG